MEKESKKERKEYSRIPRGVLAPVSAPPVCLRKQEPKGAGAQIIINIFCWLWGYLHSF